MRAAADAIASGVDERLADWVVRSVDRLLDAWGRFDPAARAAIRVRAQGAGRAASARVGDRLRELFATDPGAQRSTPLEIVRTSVTEPTELLVSLGVPPVVRDPFDERVHPDDLYDLSPRTLGDLGDADLGAQLLVWGMAKARLLREIGHSGPPVPE